MTELNQIYKCLVCGNMSEVVHESSGELVCCGKKMFLLKENSQDAALEKHVPVVEQKGNQVIVTIGEVLHPMIDEHYIEFIEILTSENYIYRKYLKPAQKPQAIFTIEDGQSVIKVREYCNLHGLWKK